MLGLQSKAPRKAAVRELSESQIHAVSQAPLHPKTTARWDSRSFLAGFFANILASLGVVASSATLSTGACESQCRLQRAHSQDDCATSSIPIHLENLYPDATAQQNSEVYGTISPWQTRLIRLEPDVWGSPIHCMLVTVDVIDGPGLGISGTLDTVQFEALSYSWGYSAPTWAIYCNAVQVAVTEQLALALHHLRFTDTPRYIWCDALCINQQDLLEKRRQVRNMLRIFEKADRVVAWLGPQLSTSAELFHAVELVKFLSVEDLQQKHSTDCVTAAESLSTSISRHLESAWFRRTWIRQEVYAARKLLLQRGPFKSDFDEFCCGIAKIRLSLASLVPPSPGFSPPSTFETYQKEYQHFRSDGSSFKPSVDRPSYVQYCLDIINTGHRFEVSDERDRLYGALGLLTSRTVRFFADVPEHLEKAVDAFPIDYDKDICHIHGDFIKFLINATGTLEILDTFSTARHSSVVAKHSWNLDFGQTQGTSLSPWHYLERDSSTPQVQMQDYLDTGKLKLSGVFAAQCIQRLDADQDIGHRIDHYIPKYRPRITLRQLIQGPQQQPSGSLTSGEDNPSYAFVFSHAMLGDSRRPASPIHHLIHSADLDDSFKQLLSSKRFAFAFVEDHDGEQSFQLASLYLLVPRAASLGDAVVSFYGSKCLHLVRKLHWDPPEWAYIGPVAAVAIGTASIARYQSMGHTGAMQDKIPSVNTGLHRSEQAEMFTLL